jgi:hypothetical protein
MVVMILVMVPMVMIVASGDIYDGQVMVVMVMVVMMVFMMSNLS